MVEPRKLFGGLGNRLFQMAYIYAQQKRGEIPDIYVQDPKYFEEYGEELRRLFGTGIEKNGMVSLHIRRGDYVNNPFYVDLTKTDYYNRAVALFPSATFLVFCGDRQQGSEDIVDQQWCRTFLESLGLTGRYELFSGRDEIEDFNMMAGCKAHINANSTFSLWAAYVGGGWTVAPKEYYTDGEQRTVYPNSFTVI